MKLLKHLHTINNHKRMVRRGCFRVGLYKQGLLHDLSKYSPAEFFVGVRYYRGIESPNNAERQENGYSQAWMHHKGRNKHHYEYWTDYSVVRGEGIIPIEMPREYLVEMFIDRVSASKNYNGKNYNDSMPLDYFRKGSAPRYMHPNTKKQLEELLIMLRDKGEDETYKYIKEVILR